MKEIEYKAVYSGEMIKGVGVTGLVVGDPSEEIIRVQARDINSGFGKALKLAREPLGNGREREIARVEFWKVLS